MSALSVDQVLSGASLGVTAGFADLLVADFDGRRVLYALDRTRGAIVEIEVLASGDFLPVGLLSLNGTFAIGGTPRMELVAGRLAVSGLDPAAGAFIALDGTGSVRSQMSEPVPGLLDAALSVHLGRDTGLLTADAGGVSLYRETSGGFVFEAALADTPASHLADISASAVVLRNDHALVAVASAAEAGVSLIRVDPGGALSITSSLGAADGLPVSVPNALGTLIHKGETHIVLGSFGTSSLSILSVDDAGGLALADHILDTTATRFQALSALDTLSVGEFAYVAAGGADGGVSLFTVLPNGRLVHLATVVDTAVTSLYRVSSIAMAAGASTLSIAVASQWEVGVTRLGYDLSNLGAVLVVSRGDAAAGTAGDDQIIGSDLPDSLSGGAGNDVIFDGAGRDVLTGGAGADLFVFAQDGVEDRVTDYRKSEDKLDLSAFDFLSDVSQVTVTPTPVGAILSYRGEVIEIVSADRTPLSEADFSNADILNVDRPPLLAIDRTMTGGPLADTLLGGAGADRIEGNGGADLLLGAGGADTIHGGDGADTIEGGAGDDRLFGGAANDLVEGGSGDDLIDGGAGSDVIYGDFIGDGTVDEFYML